jgi:hypothetical protein
MPTWRGTGGIAAWFSRAIESLNRYSAWSGMHTTNSEVGASTTMHLLLLPPLAEVELPVCDSNGCPSLGKEGVRIPQAKPQRLGEQRYGRGSDGTHKPYCAPFHGCNSFFDMVG